MVTSFFGMLKRVYRIEVGKPLLRRGALRRQLTVLITLKGWAGLYKGLST